jgi:hypothetical protein
VRFFVACVFPNSCLGALAVPTKKIIAVIAIVLLIPVPAFSQAFAEVLDGSATLNRNSSLYSVRKGSRIYEGDRLTVPDRLQLILPYGAATVTKRQGFLNFLLLRREGCGIRVQAAYRGGIGAIARPKTCNTSSIIFESLTSGAYFNPWVNTRRGSLIPNTRIAQVLPESSGANFTLVDKDDTSILAVQGGAVEAQSENAIVPVLGGQGNFTKKGEAPGPAIALDNSLALNARPAPTPLGFRLNASINPLNFLFYQGREIAPEAVLDWPVLGNNLPLEVRSADGLRSRYYWLPLPRRR